MKSKIQKLTDYKSILFEKHITLFCPPQHIVKEMRRLTLSHKRTEQVNCAAPGDVAVLSLQSALQKFNRENLVLTIGGNLFDKVFEEQLIGHKKGETFTVRVQNEPVTVSIASLTRSFYPDPTDEMVVARAKADSDLEGITTVSAYRAHVVRTYLEEQKQLAFGSALEKVYTGVLNTSDWDFAPEDLRRVREEYQREALEQLSSSGKTLEDLAPEDCQKYFQVPDRAELDVLIEEQAEETIAGILWLSHEYGVTPEEIERDGGEKYNWDFLVDYIKNSLEFEE